MTTTTTTTTTIPPSYEDITIVAYLLPTAPPGWQLCNGEQLLSIDEKYVINQNDDFVKTPDLRGRIAMSVNPTSVTPTNSFTKTVIGQNGGEEMHRLNHYEMPEHTHRFTIDCWGKTIGGYGFSGGDNDIDDAVTVGDNGGSQPHNNMPPIFVLNYIIKQPKKGGTSYKIDYPTQIPNTLFNT